jgi:hypothetical protein
MATPSSTDRQPEVGDVIEFSFLWSHEQEQGRIEGVKDRRCVIVRVLDGPRIVVVPITGTEPEHDHKITLAAGALGLARTSWIVASEVNVSDWPGYASLRGTARRRILALWPALRSPTRPTGRDDRRPYSVWAGKGEHPRVMPLPLASESR